MGKNLNYFEFPSENNFEQKISFTDVTTKLKKRSLSEESLK